MSKPLVTHAVMMMTDGTNTRFEIFRSRVLFRRGTPYINLNRSESIAQLWKQDRTSRALHPGGLDGYYHDLAAPYATEAAPVLNWKECKP